MIGADLKSRINRLIEDTYLTYTTKYDTFVVINKYLSFIERQI